MAFAVMLLAGVAAIAAEETWIGTTSGNWSAGSNWFDGTPPPGGGDPALDLRFVVFGGTAITATNDLGAPFVLNKLVLDSSSTAFLTLASVVANSLEIAGADPAIELRGAGDTLISSDLVLNPQSGDVVIHGTGTGNLSFFRTIGEAGGVRSLVINGAPPTANTQIIELFGQNTFSGGVTLNSGHLSLNGFGALGSGALTVNGGTLRLDGVSVNNAITLNSDLVIASNLTGVGVSPSATLNGAISSATQNSGLVLRNNGATLALTAVSTYTGPTTIDYAPNLTEATSAGTLRLSGNAALPNSSAIRVRAGGTLQIEAVDGPGDRLPDAAPVELRGGRFLFIGVAGTNEVIGELSGSGYSSVTVAPFGNIGNTRLTAPSLSRVERGTFLFGGPNLGAPFGSNVANILFTAAPFGLVGGGGTGANTSILPYAVGDSTSAGSSASFVTYDPVTGIRPLNAASEYVSSLTTATETSNVRLLSNASNSGVKTINALLIGSSGGVGGSGTLVVGSGALVCAANNGSLSNTIGVGLDFGAVEANIFAVSRLDILSSISGGNGLTKSGEAELRLSGNNTFTGPLTINAGWIGFSSLENLGPSSSPIVFGGTGAGLNYLGSGVVTLARDIQLGSGIGNLNASGLSSGNLVVSGTISGQGGLRISSIPSLSAPTITLSGTNSYTGPTLVTGKINLVIDSDAALGNGGGLDLATTGRLILAGPWLTSRPISLSSASQIDTAGFDAVLNGPLISGTGGNPSLIKIGDGTLVIANSSAFTSNLAVNGGTLVINNAMPAGGTLAVGVNGTLAGTGDIQRTATINGTLAPGYDGPGILGTAGVSFANGSTFAPEIESVSAFDQLNVAGGVALDGTINLALTLGFDPADGLDSFVVLANDAADAIIGTGRFAFAGNPLEEHETFFVGSQEFRISYTGGTGNDVVLDAVPEPVTCVLLFAGSALLGVRRFRKSNRRCSVSIG